MTSIIKAWIWPNNKSNCKIEFWAREVVSVDLPWPVKEKLKQSSKNVNAVGRANQIKNGGDGRSRTLYLIIIFSTSVCISWLPTVFKIIFTRILGLEIFLKNCNTIGTVTNFFLWMRSGSITANLFKSREKSIALYFCRAMTILVTNFVISYVVKLAWKSSPIFKNSPMSAINITAIGPSVEL